MTLLTSYLHSDSHPGIVCAKHKDWASYIANPYSVGLNWTDNIDNAFIFSDISDAKTILMSPSNIETLTKSKLPISFLVSYKLQFINQQGKIYYLTRWYKRKMKKKLHQ